MEDLLADPGSDTWVPAWLYGSAVVLAGVASIIFAYFNFLLLNFSRTKLLQLANGDGRRNRIEAALERHGRITHTMSNLESISKIIFILFLHILVIQSFALHGLTAVLTTFLVAGFWLVFFCRVLPFELGSRREEEVLLRMLPILNGLSTLLLPVFYPLVLFRRVLRKSIRPVTPAEEAEQITEEIMDAIEEGEREGLIQEQEADMIEAIVKLRDCEVSEVMTPRMDMFCVDRETPIENILKEAVEYGHSRIPVYKENRDTIVGVLYVKDLLSHWPKNLGNLPPLTELLRKPYFIPEAKRVSELLSEFRENKIHIAIVLDEYGGTSGLITNEDIIEEIVGEIVDEYDQEEEAELKLMGGGQADASAKLHIDALNEQMELAIPESDDYDTLGGFIFKQLGKVPTRGEVVRFGNVAFKVLDVDERRIDRIHIEVLPPDDVDAA